MIKILQLSTIIIATIFIASPTFGATAQQPPPADQVQSELIMSELDAPVLSIVDRMRGIENVKDKKWSISRGCINSGRFLKIKFLDDRTAMIKMLGKKKVILRLATSCPGIKKHGFLHVTKGRRICERHSRFEVLDGTYGCKVASISPYMELEDPPPLEELD